MESLLRDIVEQLRRGETLDERALAATIRRHNRGRAPADHFKKKQLLPYLNRSLAQDPGFRERLAIDEALEARLRSTLQLKPRRTASGVATITVLTKPRPCSSACLYCPNDIRMPKSYLSDEPACQRAERNFFDPYLQVQARLATLDAMGHVTDKVELIVLGGTWTDYPLAYQRWFISELFRALNDGLSPAWTKSGPDATPKPDGSAAEDADRGLRAPDSPAVQARRARYRRAQIPESREGCRAAACALQALVDEGTLSYNEAVTSAFEESAAWRELSSWQEASAEELAAQQERNETARHRVVGLVVETRPDQISVEELRRLRSFGCTKLQLGIQSLDPELLALNHRLRDPHQLERTLALVRLFGFKSHCHLMVNLYGSTPEKDKADFRKVVSEAPYLPDEIKLYPCVLVGGTGLEALYERGAWQPYDEETLIELLADDVAHTPPHTRISRMIRDISAHDIKAGNRKINLRQMVEARLREAGTRVEEMRFREIGCEGLGDRSLILDEISYETTVSQEHFLQWVSDDEERRLAAFLRLSLPKPAALRAFEGLPVREGDAMIREVHVYGAAAKIHGKAGIQHGGLGRALIDRACAIATAAGYARLKVISAVGVRPYYRRLGFTDDGLYQQRSLIS